MRRGNPPFLQNMVRFALYHLKSSFFKEAKIAGEMLLNLMIIIPSGICNTARSGKAGLRPIH